MLLMKRIYFDAIRTGAKTTTLRFWRAPRVRTGRTYRIQGLGSVKISAIAPTTLASLTDADARVDGFDSLAALKKALRKLYSPMQRKTRTLYQIRFVFLG